MLIHLDSSAVADAASGNARSHACIENLLLAHFEGNQVLSLLPGDATALRPLRWSDRAQRALDHADENYPQIAGLREDVSWSLELGLGPRFDDKEHDGPSGKKVIRALLHRFEKLHTTACSALLGENRTDAELFRQLGLMSRAVRRWDEVEMLHETRGAGGSTFAPEYQGLAEQGRILLAIVDSDQRHPASGVGDTCRKLQAKAATRPSYQRARPLPTRMAEGLVPLSVYREAFTFPHEREGAHDRLHTVTRLEQLLHSAPAEMSLYADFKNGLTLHQIDNPKTEAEGTYWRAVAETANRHQCTRSTPDQCTKRDDCRCHVVDGLGEHALAQVLAWSQTRTSKRDLAARFRLSQTPALAALADEVLAWGLALRPVQT